MTRPLQLHNSGIFAIESLWGDKIDKPFPSVEGILNVLKSNTKEFNYTVLNCNTREELLHSLSLAKKNSIKFRTLYFGSHGHPFGLEISYSKRDYVSLEELEDYLKTDFKLWSIHFGSCSVLDVSEDLIKDFMNKTKVRMVTGYETDVDWMESASFELLFFSYMIQGYDNLNQLRKEFCNKFGEFAKINKFRWYLKGD